MSHDGYDIISEAISAALRDGARLRGLTLERCGEEIAKAAKLVVDALACGKKVLIFGNGGSAADAQHIAAELIGRFVIERAPLPAIALTVDTSVLTAIANDYGFEQVFARQVRGLGSEGDVAIAITTSGKSPNVLAAVAAAREKKMHVIGLTGTKGAEFPSVCDACVVVPSTNTARIQEIHITIGHLICEAVDAVLGSPRANANSANASNASSGRGKVLALDELLEVRERYRNEGKTVVWTNGVFDVLHAGHLASLRAAKALGNVLVVGINTDATVKAAKGPSRPIFPAAERAEMLAALEVVDHVVVFEEPTPVEVLSKVKPDIHTKGADYAPPNGAPMPEAETVRAYGGRIEFLPLVTGRSTTATVASLRETRESAGGQ
ncbi:MAG: SIS domain-containing protein [Polyangiaceae bacterium]|nr:SIS domain-containing protein [Polyangiaceae bacterium]